MRCRMSVRLPLLCATICAAISLTSCGTWALMTAARWLSSIGSAVRSAKVKGIHSVRNRCGAVKRSLSTKIGSKSGPFDTSIRHAKPAATLAETWLPEYVWGSTAATGSIERVPSGHEAFVWPTTKVWSSLHGRFSNGMSQSVDEFGATENISVTPNFM